MQILKTTIEQSYLDSVYVISHSVKTIRTYKTSINHLRKFLSTRYDFDESELFTKLKNDEISVYEFLREFIIHLDKLEIKPKGIRSYLSGIKGYLRYQGIKINSDDFKHTVKIPKLIKTREYPLTKEMILQILHNSTSKLQTAILVSISSGLRVGELIQLQLSDIDFELNPTKITVRGNATKTRQTRETFITSEATKALKDHLKRYFGWIENGDNSQLQNVYVFGPIWKKLDKTKLNLDSAKQCLQISLRNHVRKIPELDILNENGYHAVHFHAFRKYFRTVAGNVCGRDFAEALMGHGFYMDVYYQLPEPKKREMYLDVEPHLTISDFTEVEKQITGLSTRCNDLEKTVFGLKQYLKLNSIEIPEKLDHMIKH